MLDVDSFKRINDSFGHSEGDNALKTVSSILKQARRENEWVFRFAGDEFIVLKLTPSANGLNAYMDEVNKKLAEYNQSQPLYPLFLSYGMSYFDHGSIDSFMKEMDDKMYEMKEMHHHQNDA